MPAVRSARLSRPAPSRLSDDARRRCERDDLEWRDDEVEPRPARFGRDAGDPNQRNRRDRAGAHTDFPHR